MVFIDNGNLGLFCGGLNVDKVVDLKRGLLAPGLTSYGSLLGLVEIRLEPSMNDSVVLDPLDDGNLSSILGTDMTIIHAMNGLQFQGHNICQSLLSLNVLDTHIWNVQVGLLQWSDNCHHSSKQHWLLEGLVHSVQHKCTGKRH